jgi:hypothetical protein
LQVSVDRICGEILEQAGTDLLLGYLHDRGHIHGYIVVCYLSLIQRGLDVRLQTGEHHETHRSLEPCIHKKPEYC